MSIRRTYLIDDVQKCVFQLLRQLANTESPWTSWDVVEGYPEERVAGEFDEPFVYVLKPVVSTVYKQQGGLPSYLMEMIIGMWDDRKTGGPEELNIIASHILELFMNPQTLNTTTFTITLGTTTYTNTTLAAQGIRINNIEGPEEVEVTDVKEFRGEFTLFLRS